MCVCNVCVYVMHDIVCVYVMYVGMLCMWVCYVCEYVMYVDM